jgi:hypothetical protein
MIKSCWIIKFRDGRIKFYYEQEYKHKHKERPVDQVLVEEHWFDVVKAKDLYRDKLSI